MVTVGVTVVLGAAATVAVAAARSGESAPAARSASTAPTPPAAESSARSTALAAGRARVLPPSGLDSAPASQAPEVTPAYDTAASPCPPEAAACVDVSARKAWLQDDGVVVRGPVPIEVGQPDHMTPLGTFHVEWKAEYTTSTIYGLPMPHAVFFAAGGIAFHEGPLDTPSHGCVHLRADDATAFFDALSKGDEVVVW